MFKCCSPCSICSAILKAFSPLQLSWVQRKTCVLWLPVKQKQEKHGIQMNAVRLWHLCRLNIIIAMWITFNILTKDMYYENNASTASLPSLMATFIPAFTKEKANSLIWATNSKWGDQVLPIINLLKCSRVQYSLWNIVAKKEKAAQNANTQVKYQHLKTLYKVSTSVNMLSCFPSFHQNSCTPFGMQTVYYNV